MRYLEPLRVKDQATLMLMRTLAAGIPLSKNTRPGVSMTKKSRAGKSACVHTGEG